MEQLKTSFLLLAKIRVGSEINQTLETVLRQYGARQL
jgi:hypothetical protein